MGINIFYTIKQNFRIKPHNFPKENSAELYKAQTILIGYHHSNSINIMKFHEISRFFQKSYGTFYIFKTEVQCN